MRMPVKLPSPLLTAHLSLVLVGLLLWDFVVATDGRSAVERLYGSVVGSAFVAAVVEEVRTGRYWGDRFPTAAYRLRIPADVPPDRVEAPVDPTRQVIADLTCPDCAETLPSITPEGAVREAVLEMPVGDDLLSAIVDASRASGAHGGCLLHIALRESGLNTSAKAPTSSAVGPFQFVEQTWLAALHGYGAKYGLDAEAAAISRTYSGAYIVDDPEARAHILALRLDPNVSALMAAEFTLENSAALRKAVKRPVTQGELYLAHVLGARGASVLIEAARSRPDMTAAELMPTAARANRWLFYGRDRQPRSVATLYEELTRFMSTREVSRLCSADLPFARYR